MSHSSIIHQGSNQSNPFIRLSTIESHLRNVNTSGKSGGCDIESLLNIAPEVDNALRSNIPVVALESTIISHGMPYPENLKTAQEVEDVVRKAGAIPATIAILNGTIHVGLSQNQLHTLASLGPHKTRKTSRRDLAFVVAQGLTGATTVSATALIANKAGILLFATGGIGGVHRDGHITMDVSADLTELSRTEICVVCAGAKSILDIGRTLEYLETMGVAVAAYQQDHFPAFFVGDSGHKAPLRLDSPSQCASVVKEMNRLGLGSGMILGVPISPKHAAHALNVDNAIQTALNEANEHNIIGRELTPFLLQRVNELTKGDSLRANIALIKQNARVASEIAVELCRMRELTSSESFSHVVSTSPTSEIIHHKYPTTTITSTRDHISPITTTIKGYQETKSSLHPSPTRGYNDNKESSEKTKGHIVVVGGVAIDIVGWPRTSLLMHTSNPGTVDQQWGGVARNIAVCLARLGVEVVLISAVGQDSNGKTFIDKELPSEGMSTKGIRVVEECKTAIFSATMNEHGDLVTAVADMTVLDYIDSYWIKQFISTIQSASMLIVDANINCEVLKYLCEIASKAAVPVWFEPTSVEKSSLIINANVLHQCFIISPNVIELQQMAKIIVNNNHQFSIDFLSSLDNCATVLLSKGVENIIMTNGGNGVVLYCFDKKKNLQKKKFSAFPVQKIVSVNGAGDSFVGGVVYGLNKHEILSHSILIGLQVAAMTVSTIENVANFKNIKFK